MNIRFENLGLYNIDTDYLRYLNGIEPEVQFTQEKDYEQKPFLGILVTIDVRLRHPCRKLSGGNTIVRNNGHAAHNLLFCAGKLVQRKQAMDMVIVGRFSVPAVLGSADFIVRIQGGFFLLELGQQRLGFQQTVCQQSRCQLYCKGMSMEQAMISLISSCFLSASRKNLPTNSIRVSGFSSPTSSEMWFSYRLRVVNRMLQRYFSITSRN